MKRIDGIYKNSELEKMRLLNTKLSNFYISYSSRHSQTMPISYEVLKELEEEDED